MFSDWLGSAHDSKVRDGLTVPRIPVNGIEGLDPRHLGIELVFRKELAKFENAGTWGTTQPQSALAARSV